MVTQLVSILGGWRATAFAGLAVAASITAGWNITAKNHYKQEIVEADTRHKTLVASILLDSLTTTSKISDDYEKDLKASKDKRQLVIDELRTTKRQLRDHFTCPSDDSGESEENTRLREEAAGDIIQVGADADAQVKGLQKVNEDQERTIQKLLRSR